MNNHITILEIDINAINHNLKYFKNKLHPKTKIMVVVKSFGYGSDSTEIAKFLENKVDYFAVAYTDEGTKLRNAGITIPILVLHPQIQNLEIIVENHLEPNLYNSKILDTFLEIADKKQLPNYPIHLKFNTGLNRIGFKFNDVPIILTKIKKSNNTYVASIFSHLAASEDIAEKEFTANQINTFVLIAKQMCTYLENKPIIHILNTSGIINYPQAQFDMVRLGIGLYGFGNDEKETKKLKNVTSLKSIISQINLIEIGKSVSYNRAFIAKKPIKTATIPIGHTDGISRKLGNGVGFVLVGDKKAPIIGNVCMDMIMIDITTIDCNEGDEVIIFDNQKMVEEIAIKTETIPYEILTNISQRVKRLLIFVAD